MNTPTLTSPLRIRWSGGDRTFPAGTTISIGRDPSAQIRLTDERVSRRHAELRPGADGWVLVDLGSTSGTFVGPDRVHELPIRNGVTVRFGGTTSLDDVTFEPAAFQAGMRPPPPHSGGGIPTELAAPLVLEPTVLPGNIPHRPGGQLSPNAAVGATEVSGATLHLQFGGQTRTLHPGDVISVGRGGHLSTDNPTVSREHVRIAHQGDGWYVEDANSSRGTFLDGRKITRQRVQGSMAFVLGPADAGERLVVVAAGTTEVSIARRMRNPRTLALVSACAVVVALIALVGVVTTGRDNAPTMVSADTLRRATVYIVAGEKAGSGSIIDGEQGLILTNAHVVSPDALGQTQVYGKPMSELPETPDEVVIFLAGDADDPAEPTYIAEIVAVDGYLDLAVVQITSTLSGKILEPGDLDLPEVPIGDSRALDQDDELILFGYPEAAGGLNPTKSTGNVSSFGRDGRIKDNRGWINTDALINSGNSGGMAADADGRLIGVPTRKFNEEGDIMGSMRPIHLAQPLIDDVEAGREYVSPYVTAVDDEAIDAIGFATIGNEAITTSCRTRMADGPQASDVLALTFDYRGFPAGHQDLWVVVLDGANEVLGMAWTIGMDPLEFGGAGCGTATVVFEDPVALGTELTVVFLAGANYEARVGMFTLPFGTAG